MENQDLSKLKIAELRELLKAKGLRTVGNKQELIDRLQLSIESSDPADLDLTKLEDELLNDDEDQSLLDSTQDEIQSPTGSIKSSSPETSNSSVPAAKPISLKRNISVPIPVIEAPSEPVAAADGEASADEPSKKVVKLSEMTAQERLELRAKKFGVTSTTSAAVPAAVTDEKLQARAARFGIQSQSVSSTTPVAGVVADSTSLEVLKKRAERFGAVLVPELKKAEEIEKIAKRQERFGVATTSVGTKATITGPTKTLSEYEEKALKRLERFKTAA